MNILPSLTEDQIFVNCHGRALTRIAKKKNNERIRVSVKIEKKRKQIGMLTSSMFQQRKFNLFSKSGR